MNMHRIGNIMTLIVALAIPCTGLAAEQARNQYPFSEHGTVDAGLQSGVLVISDSTYHVSDETRVSNIDGKTATMGDLKQGTKVGFNMYGTRAQRYLSDVWILPASFDFDSLADE